MNDKNGTLTNVILRTVFAGYDPYLCHIDIVGFSCGLVSLKTLHYCSLILRFNRKFPLLLNYQI